MSKTVEILTTFRGDPNETGAAETLFRAGATISLDDAYADLLIAKGLARAAPADAPSPDSLARADAPRH
jgi:hypothetical protein